MNRFFKKTWFTTVIVCLSAILSTCAESAVSVEHHGTEDSTNEVVEFEEGEAIAERRVGRSASKTRSTSSWTANKNSLANSTLKRRVRAIKATTERDNLNGIGGYLRT